MRKEGCNWSKYSHLIDEPLRVLNGLQQWKVNHTRRFTNGVAYSLTREGLYPSEERVFIEEIPHCIVDIIFVEHCA
jgi:hypothetical protein